LTSAGPERDAIIGLRLDSAEQALADAESPLAADSIRGAVNRCYYAAIYAASALALRDGESFRRHSALIAYFQREYIKTGRPARDLGRILQKAFDSRSETDYQDVVRLVRDDAAVLLEECRRFVAEIEAVIVGPWSALRGRGRRRGPQAPDADPGARR
jgi:hypothetical protein